MYKFSSNTIVRSFITLLIVVLGLVGMMSTDGANAAPLGVTAVAATNMGTGFSYQGNLTDAGDPANGVYDFRFQVWGVDGGALQPVSPQIIVENVNVVDGLFSTKIDAGGTLFNGDRRLLQVAARKDGETDFADIGGPTEISPAPYALYAAEAGVAKSLKDIGETVIEVGHYNMFQGGTSTDLTFAARGTGRMQVTHAGGLDVRFVYVPVDIPTKILGFEQKLKTLSFCYSGAGTNEIPVLAGIDSIQVRQADKLESSILLDRFYDNPLKSSNECVNITADTPQTISGSVWIQFRVTASNTPLEFGEIKLTLVNE